MLVVIQKVPFQAKHLQEALLIPLYASMTPAALRSGLDSLEHRALIRFGAFQQIPLVFLLPEEQVVPFQVKPALDSMIFTCANMMPLVLNYLQYNMGQLLLNLRLGLPQSILFILLEIPRVTWGLQISEVMMPLLLKYHLLLQKIQNY